MFDKETKKKRTFRYFPNVTRVCRRTHKVEGWWWGGVGERGKVIDLSCNNLPLFDMQTIRREFTAVPSGPFHTS